MGKHTIFPQKAPDCQMITGQLVVLLGLHIRPVKREILRYA